MCASERLSRGLAATLAAVLTLGAALATGPAWAQQQPSREQEQIRRLRLQVQQLQQQAQAQAAVQASLQQAEGELASLRKSLADAQAAGGRSRAAAERQAREAEGLQQQLQAAQQAADAQAAAQQALRAELQGLVQARSTLQQEQAALRRALAEREDTLAALNSRHLLQAQGLQACIDSNQALHALGGELLQRWSGKTVAEVLQRDEPLLQYKRVALENLVLGYRDKLDAQALALPAAGNAAAGAPAGMAAALPTGQALAADARAQRAGP